MNIAELVGVALALSSGLSTAQSRLAAPVNPLNNVKALRCEFSARAIGTWTQGEPRPTVTSAGVLVLQFDEIEPQQGSARLKSSSMHIVAQLSGWSLHLLDIDTTGALSLTTVFGRESRNKKLKATYTRTDYQPTGLPGYPSEPEVSQSYGECEIVQ